MGETNSSKGGSSIGSAIGFYESESEVDMIELLRTGRPPYIRAVLRRFKALVGCVDEKRRTALRIATDFSRPDVVRMLVHDMNADVDALDEACETSLIAAARARDMDMVRELLSLEADPLRRDASDASFLHIMCRIPSTESAELIGRSFLVVYDVLFASQGSQLDELLGARTRRGDTPLHLAAAGMRVDLVRLLTHQFFADTDLKNDEGKTPVDMVGYAVTAAAKVIVQILTESVAEESKKNADEDEDSSLSMPDSEEPLPLSDDEVAEDDGSSRAVSHGTGTGTAGNESNVYVVSRSARADIFCAQVILFRDETKPMSRGFAQVHGLYLDGAAMRRTWMHLAAVGDSVDLAVDQGRELKLAQFLEMISALNPESVADHEFLDYLATVPLARPDSEAAAMIRNVQERARPLCLSYRESDEVVLRNVLCPVGSKSDLELEPNHILSVDAIELGLERLGESNVVVDFLLDNSPAVLANALTYVAKKLFISVRPGEFLDAKWTKACASTLAPHLTALSGLYNRVGGLIVSEVLLGGLSAARQAELLGKAIEVAWYCLEQSGDFFTSFSITASLSTRMNRAMTAALQSCPQALQKQYHDLEKASSPAAGFRNYREAVSKRLKGFYLPFLPVLLRECVRLSEMVPRWLQPNVDSGLDAGMSMLNRSTSMRDGSSDMLAGTRSSDTFHFTGTDSDDDSDSLSGSSPAPVMPQAPVRRSSLATLARSSSVDDRRGSSLVRRSSLLASGGSHGGGGSGYASSDNESKAPVVVDSGELVNEELVTNFYEVISVASEMRAQVASGASTLKAPEPKILARLDRGLRMADVDAALDLMSDPAVRGSKLKRSIKSASPKRTPSSGRLQGDDDGHSDVAAQQLEVDKKVQSELRVSTRRGVVKIGEMRCVLVPVEVLMAAWVSADPKVLGTLMFQAGRAMAAHWLQMGGPVATSCGPTSTPSGASLPSFSVYAQVYGFGMFRAGDFSSSGGRSKIGVYVSKGIEHTIPPGRRACGCARKCAHTAYMLTGSVLAGWLTTVWREDVHFVERKCGAKDGRECRISLSTLGKLDEAAELLLPLQRESWQEVLKPGGAVSVGRTVLYPEPLEAYLHAGKATFLASSRSAVSGRSCSQIVSNKVDLDDMPRAVFDPAAGILRARSGSDDRSVLLPAGALLRNAITGKDRAFTISRGLVSAGTLMHASMIHFAGRLTGYHLFDTAIPSDVLTEKCGNASSSEARIERVLSALPDLSSICGFGSVSISDTSVFQSKAFCLALALDSSAEVTSVTPTAKPGSPASPLRKPKASSRRQGKSKSQLAKSTSKDDPGIGTDDIPRCVFFCGVIDGFVRCMADRMNEERMLRSSDRDILSTVTCSEVRCSLGETCFFIAAPASSSKSLLAHAMDGFLS